MIPDPFRLVVRQVRTDRGMGTDIAAGRARQGSGGAREEDEPY